LEGVNLHEIGNQGVEECPRGPETIKSSARCHGRRGIPDIEI